MRCLVLSPEAKAYYLRTLRQWRDDCAALHEQKRHMEFEAFRERRTELHVRYLALIANSQPEDLVNEEVAAALIAAAYGFFLDSEAAPLSGMSAQSLAEMN